MCVYRLLSVSTRGICQVSLTRPISISISSHPLFDVVDYALNSLLHYGLRHVLSVSPHRRLFGIPVAAVRIREPLASPRSSSPPTNKPACCPLPAMDDRTKHIAEHVKLAHNARNSHHSHTDQHLHYAHHCDYDPVGCVHVHHHAATTPQNSPLIGTPRSLSIRQSTQVWDGVKTDATLRDVMRGMSIAYYQPDSRSSPPPVPPPVCS
jgi:hypothetical protein